MSPSNVFSRIGRCLLLLTLFAGCATRRVDNVEQMSQTYKVGITRFSDFKRDAKLVEVQTFATQGRSVIPPTYAALKPSPFEIFDQHTQDNTWNTQFGGDTNQVVGFVVGDGTGKTCVLHFQVRDEKLISINVYTN